MAVETGLIPDTQNFHRVEASLAGAFRGTDCPHEAPIESMSAMSSDLCQQMRANMNDLV